MRLLLLAGIAGAALVTSGCSEKPAAPQPTASQTADATPENAPGITLTAATVQLPAVSGRPGVAYFTLSQGNGAPRKLVAVHVDGFGRSEMHESKTAGGVSSMAEVKQVDLAAGQTIEFKPGGYHVMLFDLDGSLKAGGTSELTVTLDNGDKASVEAKVTGPGGSDMGAMDHMDHM